MSQDDREDKTVVAWGGGGQKRELKEREEREKQGGTLDLVVARHLGAVEDHGTHHIGLDAAVEARDALRLEQRA
jgi:hypothetical protein